MERDFAAHMAETGNQVYAATKAGARHPSVQASQFMSRPAVRAEVIRRTEDLLTNELLPLAYAAHKRLLTGKGVPAGAQLGAVKLAYDRTLGAEGDQAAEKEPSEMTYNELQASITRLKTEQAAREEGAIDVTPEPVELEQPEAGVFG